MNYVAETHAPSAIEHLVASLQVDVTQRVACPDCSHERSKANQKDLVIHRKSDAWTYYCHHCQAKGFVRFKNFHSPRHQPVKRMEQNVIPLRTFEQTQLSQPHIEFLKTRGISEATALSVKLFSADKYFGRIQKQTDAIGFPYFKGGQYIGSKYRSTEAKDFTQDSGGVHCFFGVDSLDATKPIIIVEGEMDALTLIECGIENGVSVPSGAPVKVSDGKVDASEDKRFSFVWDAFEILSKAPYIVIATDTDTAGQALAEELARRIGKDKCRVARSDTYKDMNEAFLAEGADAVKKIIDKAEPYPVAGLSAPSKYADRLNDLWSRGNGHGTSTGYSNVDQIYTVAEGQLTVVTGYPSCGKSNFVDQLMVNLAKTNDWKFAICSFENQPEIHISRLMELHREKRFFDGTHRMSDAEKSESFEWVEQHFMFLDSETVEPATIDSVLDRAKIAVARMGIRGLVIDPYNYIENDGGKGETEFISTMLTRVQAFAKAYGVHVWFVAHPAKITRSGMDLPRPDGMAISGSMAWWAKADCGLTVHRTKGNGVEIAVWKCRYRWVGTQGETTLLYNKVTGSYSEPVDAF
jgi:twinkle protein